MLQFPINDLGFARVQDDLFTHCLDSRIGIKNNINISALYFDYYLQEKKIFQAEKDRKQMTTQQTFKGNRLKRFRVFFIWPLMQGHFSIDMKGELVSETYLSLE
jgi:hypothetical protein